MWGEDCGPQSLFKKKEVYIFVWEGNFLKGSFSLGRVVVPFPLKYLQTFLGHKKSFAVKEKHTGLVVRDILLLLYLDKIMEIIRKSIPTHIEILTFHVSKVIRNRKSFSYF